MKDKELKKINESSTSTTLEWKEKITENFLFIIDLAGIPGKIIASIIVFLFILFFLFKDHITKKESTFLFYCNVCLFLLLLFVGLTKLLFLKLKQVNILPRQLNIAKYKKNEWTLQANEGEEGDKLVFPFSISTEKKFVFKTITKILQAHDDYWRMGLVFESIQGYLSFHLYKDRKNDCLRYRLYNDFDDKYNRFGEFTQYTEFSELEVSFYNTVKSEGNIYLHININGSEQQILFPNIVTNQVSLNAWADKRPFQIHFSNIEFTFDNK